jgi:hypothetical protein
MMMVKPGGGTIPDLDKSHFKISRTNDRTLGNIFAFKGSNGTDGAPLPALFPAAEPFRHITP